MSRAERARATDLVTKMLLAVLPWDDYGDRERPQPLLDGPGYLSDESLWHTNSPLALKLGRIDIMGVPAYNMAVSTARVMGSSPLALLAHIDGWCENHAVIKEEDRAWAADLIDQGLASWIMRREVNGYDNGWEAVTELLRAIDEHPGPVVSQYSVAGSFPNLEGVLDYGDEADRRRFSSEDEDERERLYESYYKLPREEQWDLAMRALRRRAENQCNYRICSQSLHQPYCATGLDVARELTAGATERS